MMRSLYSGISGLRNHQTRMDVIGNNIANVNTAGYKTSRVIFQDIFSQNVSAGMGNQGEIGGTNPTQIGLGIRLSTVDVIHTRAAFQRTDNPTDMMINGDGFFVVGTPEGYFYTRAGNFVIDNDGYLVNSQGLYVMGNSARLKMGVVDVGSAGDDPPVIWDGVTPATPPAGYRAPVIGIVAEPEETPLWDDDMGFTQGLNRIRVKAFPTSNTAPIPAAQHQVLIGLYNAIENPLTGTPPGTRALLQQARESGDPLAIAAAQTAFATSVAALDAWFEIDHPGIGNFAEDPTNPRDLTGFNVGDNGDVSVILQNRKVVIGRIQVAMFSNPPGLEKAGNGLYRETASSGGAVIDDPLKNGAGRIDGGGLEMSNVDLADQFTDMIVTQRGFQANSRIITVSDTMLEELVNLKR